MKSQLVRAFGAALLVLMAACLESSVSADVVYVSTDGGTIDKVSADGTVSRFATGLHGPAGLALDTGGNLYVANRYDNTISRITPDGTARTFATGLKSPFDLAFDSADNLYVLNADSIDKVTPDGTVHPFVKGVSGYGLAFEGSDLFVAANSSGAILEVAPTGKVSNVAAGLRDPYDLAFDSTGNAYYSDRQMGTIFKVSSGGASVTKFATSVWDARGVAFGSGGNLYVASNEATITRIAVDGTSSTFAKNLDGVPLFVAVQIPEPASGALPALVGVGLMIRRRPA